MRCGEMWGKIGSRPYREAEPPRRADREDVDALQPEIQGGLVGVRFRRVGVAGRAAYETIQYKHSVQWNGECRWAIHARGSKSFGLSTTGMADWALTCSDVGVKDDREHEDDEKCWEVPHFRCCFAKMC